MNFADIVKFLKFRLIGFSEAGIGRVGRGLCLLAVVGTLAPAGVALDSDRDGLPDDWESLHQLNPYSGLYSSLAGWWTFDQTAGLVASNAAGTNYHGELVNLDASAWTNGLLGGALRFDGASGYVSVPQDPPVVTGQTFTLSAWVWLEADFTLGAWPTVLADTEQAGGAYPGFQLFFQDAATPTLSVGDNAHGYTFLYDSYAGYAGRFYLDGIEIGATAAYFDPVGMPDLLIGQGPDDGMNYHWKGLLDDLRIYTAALSTNQLDTLYDAFDDPDADTLDNRAEFAAGTSPRAADTDLDGWNDNVELATRGTSPVIPDRAEPVTNQPIVFVLPTVGLLREVWTNLPGKSVTNLTYTPAYRLLPPNLSGILTNLAEAPTNFADSYGQQFRGIFQPPVSGDYRFWIASDDMSELWLGTRDATRVRIAHVPAYTTTRQWTKYTNQLSAPIHLESGAVYRVHALAKEDAVIDHLALGIQFPSGTQERPMLATRFAPPASFRSPMPLIPCVLEAETFDLGGEGTGYHDGDPANQGQSYRLQEGVDVEACSDPAGGDWNVSWTRPGEWLNYTLEAPTSGVHRLTLRVAAASAGGRLRVICGGVTSAPVVIPVTGGWQVWTNVFVGGISVPAGVTTLQLLAEDGSFSLNFAGLLPDFGLVREVWTNVAGTAVSALTNFAAYPARPATLMVLSNAFEAPVNAGNNYGQRVSGWFVVTAGSWDRRASIMG